MPLLSIPTFSQPWTGSHHYTHHTRLVGFFRADTHTPARHHHHRSFLYTWTHYTNLIHYHHHTHTPGDLSAHILPPGFPCGPASYHRLPATPLPVRCIPPPRCYRAWFYTRSPPATQILTYYLHHRLFCVPTGSYTPSLPVLHCTYCTPCPDYIPTYQACCLNYLLLYHVPKHTSHVTTTLPISACCTPPPASYHPSLGRSGPLICDFTYHTTILYL